MKWKDLRKFLPEHTKDLRLTVGGMQPESNTYMSDVYESHKSIDGWLHVLVETRLDSLGKQVAANEEAMRKVNVPHVCADIPGAMCAAAEVTANSTTVTDTTIIVMANKTQSSTQVECTSECPKPALLPSSSPPHCNEPVAKRSVDKVLLTMPIFGWIALLVVFAVLYKISSSPGYHGLNVKNDDAVVTPYASTLHNLLLILEEEARKSVNLASYDSIASLAGQAMPQVFAISSDAGQPEIEHITYAQDVVSADFAWDVSECASQSKPTTVLSNPALACILCEDQASLPNFANAGFALDVEACASQFGPTTVMSNGAFACIPCETEEPPLLDKFQLIIVTTIMIIIGTTIMISKYQHSPSMSLSVHTLL
jgi:hypothetical protein